MSEGPDKRSPIEVLIDLACQGRPVVRKAVLTAEEKQLANGVAGSVLYHIDTMYPRMWSGVAKAARTSLRNTIVAEVGVALIKAREGKG